MKKALVHEWFVVYGGAERCVESFTNIWEDFDIYALVDFLKDDDRKKILKGKYAKTSFIQKLPFAKTKYRSYLPFFPLAIEQFDLSEYDLILSSSHAVAKGVITHENQLHISYIHTPMRYAWDLYFQYLRESGLDKGIKGILPKYLLHKIRIWDISTVNRVDYYIANSQYVARRIEKIYGKKAKVIYPPVDVDKFTLSNHKEDYYLTASRMVPYKKIDLIVETFAKIGKKLIVIGDGPLMKRIKSKATRNIEILGYQPDDVLSEYMQKAKGFVYAAVEDFGILPVEAQASGTPVISLRKGGTGETVIDGKTGVHFEKQTVEDLSDAIHRFEKIYDSFDPEKIRRHALKFRRERFEWEIKAFVEEKYEEFKNRT